MKPHLFLLPFLPLVIVTLALGATGPANFKGAEGIIREVLAGNTGVQDKGSDAVPQLRTDIEGFPKTVATLPPADAARAWLNLVDRMLAIPKDELKKHRGFFHCNSEREPIAQNSSSRLPAFSSGWTR
ncbi:MAG: hypothetical protein H0X40_14670 [Chthoniobacterales bacterium]|nr:hypothetical protein [Chthoniobacterales bacterium]